jgi:gluconate 2-dehydrogenase gamma chain
MKRRSFLAGTAVATLAGSACRREQSTFRTLSVSEAETLRALCGQIVPADDQPGADWAGSVQFIDIQLTRHYKRYRQQYTNGLKRAAAIAATRFGHPLAELSSAQQLESARELERVDPEFFNMLVAHTMQSFYGSPRHGGNRDAVSWRMLGVAPVQVRGRS